MFIRLGLILMPYAPAAEKLENEELKPLGNYKTSPLAGCEHIYLPAGGELVLEAP